MTNRKQNSLGSNNPSTIANTQHARPSSQTAVDRVGRRDSREERWATGFLTSKGTQIPLFVSPVRRLLA